ncbi:hypothetical protein PP914_gp021 [Arthrobacter phage Qui]|uniref:Uncharacterized protein n=1 Tax=Arthrobacter phage Qui TaxID=2603260 RepID=A0A5B8WLN7_9CAUD|nr:hypothetical protein PP914_gp021 [Arthrobacter phage Qui]QED11512.1 hypothetical protein SEA_QUI_21 [Arthrobacter phage Qui]QOC56343.1 hypothetical protein SEA_PAELLA_21 [Arthrobacter phage Paella]
MSDVTDDFLSHYGVQGMKWGKHKAGGGSGSGGGTNKAAVKEARKDMYKSAGAHIKANKGKTVVAALLTGGSATVGYNLARSSGLSKGQSVAVAALGGAPGGMLAIEISARKSARED